MSCLYKYNNEYYTEEEILEFIDSGIINIEAYYQIKESPKLKVDTNEALYTDGTFKFMRVNTLQHVFSSQAKERSGRSNEDIAKWIAEKTWKKNKLTKDQTYEHKAFAADKRPDVYSFDEFVEFKKKELEYPFLSGKAIHNLFAAMEETDPARKKMFEDAAEEFRKKAGINVEDFDQYREYFDVVKSKLKISATDVVHNEATFSLELPDFNYTGTDGIQHVIKGYAGTVDKYILHNDGTVTLVDYKTGSMHQLGNKLMNYSLKAGVKFLDSPMNGNTLNLAMYALMMKASNRNLKFRDINFIKINDKGTVTKLDSGTEFDLGAALKLLREYFKDKHYAFYAANKDLFVINNYFASSVDIQFKIESVKKAEKLTTEQARMKVRDTVIVKFRDIVRSRQQFLSRKKKNLTEEEKKTFEGIDEQYNDLLQEIIELSVGNNPFKSGDYHYMDQLQAWFSNRYGQANPLIASLSTMYGQAKQQVRSEFIDLKHTHDILLKAVKEEYYKSHSKKLVGVDYNDFYSFMWIKKDNKLNLITYLDTKEWSELTEAQKKYADYYRQVIRYQLFKTMDPEEGIAFIKAELNSRVGITDETKTFLNNQISILEKVVPYDKFEQSGYGEFSYFEGWTPRVGKTTEESKNITEYISKLWSSNFISSEEELLNSMLPDEIREKIIGLPLKYMADSENSAINHEELYTFNSEIVFNAFVSHVITKEHMDDVYNIGEGIKHFMEQQDEVSDRKLNENNIKFIDSFIKGVVLGKKTDSFNRIVTIGNKHINVDHFIRSLRSYFGVTTLALNVVGAVGTGINQSLKTMQMAVTGSLVKNPDMDLKSARKVMKEIFKWKSDQMFGRVSGKPESASVNKLALFLDMFGFLPKSYDYYETGASHSKLVTKEGFLLPSWVNNDLLLKLYSSVDNLNYATYLLGQLHKMETTVGDKKVSMWDAYEVIGGKLVYVGKERGIDESTGEVIAELNGREIDKLRAFAERDLGPYREDERSQADMGSLSSLYMMFKRWLPPLMKRAFSGQYENMTLGEYVQQGGEIDEETGFPKLKWMPRTDEGFVTSLRKYIWIVSRAIVSKNKGTLREELAKMTPVQRYNFWYAMVKLGSFAALMLIIGAVFGDNDEDDRNTIKRMAIRVKNETVFEFIVWDPQKWADTLVSAAPIEKLFTTLDGLQTVVFRGVLPDLLGGEPAVVQSGDHEGWYKGFTDLVRGTKYASTMFGFWELGRNWESLEDDIDAARTQ